MTIYTDDWTKEELRELDELIEKTRARVERVRGWLQYEPVERTEDAHD